MSSKIVVVRSKDNIITSLFENEELTEVQVDKNDSSRMIGNIYLGRVQNIVKNINAAFVEVENGATCYLSLTELGNPVFTDNDHPGKLRVGDQLIIQVTKENSRYKAPSATTQFSITGKNLVLVHGKPVLGISQKIKDEETRSRLKSIIKPYLTSSYGFIVRTNAEKASDTVIENEIGRLISDYEMIIEYGIHWDSGSRLYSAPPAFLWEIRDGYAEEISEIITDDEELFNQMSAYIKSYQPEDIPKLRLYNSSQLSLKKLYAIEEKLDKLLLERVWLSSGAYLIIQRTEALTVIDVNTGRAIRGKGDQEDTFYDVNLEAAEEISKQLRLRNLSGIIIVDFIDMKNREHSKELLSRMSVMLSKDRIPTQIVDMTALNLVEITRKKIRKPVEDQINGK